METRSVSFGTAAILTAALSYCRRCLPHTMPGGPLQSQPGWPYQPKCHWHFKLKPELPVRLSSTGIVGSGSATGTVSVDGTRKGLRQPAAHSTGTGSAMQQWAVFLSPLAGLAGYTLVVWHHRDSAVSLTGVNAL